MTMAIQVLKRPLSRDSIPVGGLVILSIVVGGLKVSNVMLFEWGNKSIVSRSREQIGVIHCSSRSNSSSLRVAKSGFHRSVNQRVVV